MALMKRTEQTIACKLKHFAIQEIARAIHEDRSAIIPIDLKKGVDYCIDLSEAQLADLTAATMADKSSIKLKLSPSQLKSAVPIEIIADERKSSTNYPISDQEIDQACGIAASFLKGLKKGHN